MTPARLFRQRMSQIERAYKARNLPTLTRTAKRALERERLRQIRLAEAERDVVPTMQRGIKRVSKPIGYPKKKPSIKRPSKRVSHAKKASRFWKHFARDGQPVSPWEISVGPGMDIDDDEASAMDEPLFAEGGYDYEDFDADWGGYEYEDTGYPDEDA
jgi:hypothetical protein